MGTCSPELLKPGHSFDEVSGLLVKCGEPSDDMVAVDGIDRPVLFTLGIVDDHGRRLNPTGVTDIARGVPPSALSIP